MYKYSDYALIYGADEKIEKAFARLCWDAEKYVNDATTGVDGICKLKAAYPTNEYDVECVKRAVFAVIDKMNQVEEMNAKLQSGGVIKSMSAGNESVSYETSGEISRVAVSRTEQGRLYMSVVEGYLSGARDNNGVNLLYRGMYPYRL